MSESETDSVPTTAKSQVKESSRPQTVSLTKLRHENNSSEDNTSIGDTFFSKNDDGSVESADNNDLTAKVQDTNGTQDDHSTDTASPKPRPKTVTKSRTDGYQQCLVDIGAVESNTPKPTQNQTLSPKPKSKNCYICGKEFLLSSLKVHEKQCTKKHEKTSKTNNDKSSKLNTKTSSVSKISKKPQLEACYLCGKEFFIHSLGIHETQCIRNWKANKTPDAKDQSVSERTMTEKEYNNAREEIEVDVCIQTEQKSAKKEQSKTQNASPKLEVKLDLENNVLMEGDQQSTKKEVTKTQNALPKLEKKTDSPKQRRLKTMPCYSCGVSFLPHSLKIHEKKCRGQSHDLNHSNLVEKDEASPGEENSTLKETEGSQNETDPQNIDETNDSLEPGSSKTFISKKPKTIVCYICGQEFLKSSYAFHEKKCASMNESTKAEETPLENSKVSNTRNSTKPKTIICHICGEEFLKSSYQFHEKKCSNMAENSEEKATVPETIEANQNQVKNSPKPRTIVCYICGQEFLKSSYAFHEKQCSKNKKVEELEESQNDKSTTKGNVTNKEKASSDSHIKRPQTPRRGPKTKTCYICGKEILLSSLKVHEQQCQKKTDILKSINQQKAPAQSKKTERQSGAAKLKSETKPKTEPCYICGESFLSSSIKVHETQCEKRWNEKT